MRACSGIRLVLGWWVLLVLPACSRSVEESCQVVCEKDALCNEDSVGASKCESVCKDLASKDESYADALVDQADCYEKNAAYYDDPKGVCAAIRGGACAPKP